MTPRGEGGEGQLLHLLSKVIFICFSKHNMKIIQISLSSVERIFSAAFENLKPSQASLV